MRNWLDRLWCIGRRSNVAYVRFYPNPGFMLPLIPGKRLRWSKHYGWKVTKSPVPGNPRGL
jgi:hypothetical protein